MGSALQGRRVLVTGASSGIGAATARAISHEGGHVALLARRAEPLRALAAELDGIAVPADVIDVGGVRSAVDEAAERLGGLDGLVNAAGVLRGAAISTADPEEWRLTFEVNVLGVLQAIQPAIPYLRQAVRADVVNVSSMSGRRLGSAELAVYAASKAALHMVSEGLRRELAPDGIRVCVIAPGFVRTELFGERPDDLTERLRAAADEIGLSVDDVAASIVHVLAAPPRTVHAEVALLSIDQ